jgi:hypothetical protein
LSGNRIDPFPAIFSRPWGQIGGPPGGINFSSCFAAHFQVSNFDGFVKSRFYPVFVIPAKAGIQLNQAVLDSRLRGSDGFFDFLRDHHF